jgi:Mn-containing catalase
MNCHQLGTIPQSSRCGAARECSALAPDQVNAMYHHVKKLMYTVRVDEPDPSFGNMLLEQFGGANGELAAAMQYSIQGLNCDDLERKDLLMDIVTEELCHLEVVGTLAGMHLKPM